MPTSEVPAAEQRSRRRWFPRRRRSWAQRYHDHSAKLIRQLEIPDIMKKQLLYRWLDEVDWIERSAGSSLRMHHLLRFVAIVGGVLVSGLLGLNATGQAGDNARVAAFIISLVVTGALSLDEYFRLGEKHRHTRLVVEKLRSEGSLYFALAGPYENRTHQTAFRQFAARVEAIATADVVEWVTKVIGPRAEDRSPSDD
ncbi:MAG: DUF4231 domain-containing protein, partial [Chloroflexota bacterium]